MISDCQFWTVAQPLVGTSGMEESVFHAGGHGDSLGEQLRPSRVIRVCVCNMYMCCMSVCLQAAGCVGVTEAVFEESGSVFFLVPEAQLCFLP